MLVYFSASEAINIIIIYNLLLHIINSLSHLSVFFNDFYVVFCFLFKTLIYLTKQSQTKQNKHVQEYLYIVMQTCVESKILKMADCLPL